MPGPTPNAIDLTTVAKFIAWTSPGSTFNATEQQNVQDCITAASAYWLWALGLGPQDGSDPTDSPLNSQVAGINETYDGSGSSRQFVRVRPIVSVQSLLVDGIAIPASSGINVPGFVVDGTGKSVSIRSGFGAPAVGQRLTVGFSFFRSGRGWSFTEGVQNVQITYTAGYSATPFDIELAVRQMVAVNYKRRQWIDQKLQAMAQGAGTISFRDWEFPPEVKSVMDHYRRRALA
jgi:hypothetical protein